MCASEWAGAWNQTLRNGIWRMCVGSNVVSNSVLLNGFVMSNRWGRGEGRGGRGGRGEGERKARLYICLLPIKRSERSM